MTKQKRWSYVVLALTVILIGFLQLGGPFLALLFSYLVLTKPLLDVVRNLGVQAAFRGAHGPEVHAANTSSFKLVSACWTGVLMVRMPVPAFMIALARKLAVPA